MTDGKEELVKRIGDEESDAKGHENYPGDEDDAAEREGHDWPVKEPNGSDDDAS